jgi:hypothetical protein
MRWPLVLVFRRDDSNNDVTRSHPDGSANENWLAAKLVDICHSL